MIKVQVAVTFANPTDPELGKIVELEDEVAADWITKGWGIPVREQVVETAILAPAETAVTRGPGRPRKVAPE